MGSPSDAETFALVLAGDAQAFGAIWDRYRDRTFRHFVGLGMTAADAEDLVAVVFLELWRRRRSVRIVNGSILPWLIVTTRNVARNAERSRRRYRRFLASLPEPAPQPDHAERFAEADDDRATLLRAAMRQVRADDASLLALTTLEGFTVSEAAQAMKLSEPAARMRLSRLRAHLRAVVGPPRVEGNTDEP